MNKLENCRLKSACCALIVLVLVLVPVINRNSFAEDTQESADSDFTGTEDGAVRRCGTPDIRLAVAEQIQKKIASLLPDRENDYPGEESPQIEGFPPGGVVIPIVFHVIHNGQEGKLAEFEIMAQIDVLNYAYSGTGVQFVLADIDYTDNPAWFGISSSSEEMSEAKAALTSDSSQHLNVYTTLLEEDLLGFATFPNEQTEKPEKDGVVLLYTTFPGGEAAPYDEGDTAVHEIGHWLGLYHTFQTFIQNIIMPPVRTSASLIFKSGCLGPGDYIDDTPAERTPSSGCNEYRNSCLARPGRDPVRNFMDYSPDSCMDEFTPGQVARIQAMIVTYRPGLLDTSTATTSIAGGPVTTTTSVMDGPTTTTTVFSGTTTTSAANQGVPVIDSLTVFPDSGYAGDDEFTATNFIFTCIAHDPDGSVVKYVWDFDGDGEIDLEESTGAVWGVYYFESGNYIVQVQVYDNDGNVSDIASVQVTVW